MKKKINKVIMYLWQFPQNILAICLEGILCSSSKRGPKYGGNTSIICDIFPSSLSLGDYIFIHSNSSLSSIRHECGHCKQSKILGPIYLIIVGLPSIIHRIIWGICKKLGIHWDYNKFFTESWATKLGNSTINLLPDLY